MLQTTQGIVLRTVKYADTSMIADLYTRESGRTSFVVRLPRTRKSAGASTDEAAEAPVEEPEE